MGLASAELDCATMRKRRIESTPPDSPPRANEPELGFGCGRASSTDPSEWALIGVSNGVEEWEADAVVTRLDETRVYTTFEPHSIGISPEEVSGASTEGVTL